MKSLKLVVLAFGLGVSGLIAGCGGGSSSSSGGTGSNNPPSPTVTSISPTTVPAGSADLTITVNGAGFVSTTVIQVGGKAEATTYISSTRVTAVVPAGQLAAGADLNVVAVNGAQTSGSGATTRLEVTNPAPAITSVAPASFVSGATSPVVTVTGTGFVSSTVIQVNGSARPTTFVSSTQVSVALTTADVSAASSLSLTAVNPAPGGGTSTAAAVAVVTPNPVPTITALSPTTASLGIASQVIAVNGTGFLPTTVINVNGSARATSYSNATLVNLTLTAADVSALGSLSLIAVNPTPGGGTSAAFLLPVNNPPVGMIHLSPSALVVGGISPVTISITGNTFLPNSTVQVNGVTRASTYVSSTKLTFVATVADQASLGTFLVTVTNPAPGGGTSPAAVLTIGTSSPTPVISSINPNLIYTGSTDTQITIFGTGFTVDSTVQWNGSALVVNSFGYNSYGLLSLVATVPAADLAAAGTATVTVSTPTANPALSNAMAVTIKDPPPSTLTSVSPATGPINTATALTLYGTDFLATSKVEVNGTSVPTTFVSSTQLSANLPASAVRLPGNLQITVSTPPPGGGISGALTYTAYIPIANNSMAKNPATGLLYVTVPSSAGAPYGNTVVSIDPETGSLGTPIPVGSEPNRIAVTDDGKYLWVGLDGASAVRRVNLTAGAADLQFSIGGNNTGWYANPATVQAIAALPGSDTAVVVGTNGTGIATSSINIAIYDSGVLRGTAINNFVPTALQVSGSNSEVYAASSNSYAVYTYSAAGLVQKGNIANNGTYASYGVDDLQVAGGRTYTDLGTVYDAEAGALLGTFYASGTAPAQGPTVADTGLGRVFVLDNPQGYIYASGYTQIQAFNISDFNPSSSNVVPISVSTGSTYSGSASHLTRWGTDGLAFRTNTGVYSLRTNLVKDLSATSADLGLSLASSGATATGANTTYTATVTNNGPSTATGVALTAQLPSTGMVLSATPTIGSCSSSTAGVTCNLGSLAKQATAKVTIVVLQAASGSVDASAQVIASENDPVLTNNQAATTVTVSGAVYNLQPTVASISPSGIRAGAGDTVITVTGAAFDANSTVQLNGADLGTSYESPTTLTATVPSADLATMGWAAITVANPAPGGGTSNVVPLTVYNVITIGVNHILYDPYSRRIMAAVASGSSSVAGNSIAPITPETGTVGTAVNIGSQPTNLALTSDGQILYTILTGSQSIARFNMLTQQPDFTWQVPNMSNNQLRGITTQPGNENTIALDLGSWAGNAIFDFDPANKTAAMRGQASGPYTGSCIVMPTATDMLSFDTDTTGATLDHYTVTSAGFQYYNYGQFVESTLTRGGCFKADGKKVFTVTGGVADWTTNPATQLGIFSISGGSMWGYNGDVLPDASLGRTFYAIDSTATCCYPTTLDSLEAFDNSTYMPAGNLSIDFAQTEGTNSSYTLTDMIRWGQDGIAILTSGGHIYLLRGPIVVPELLHHNSAATLTSSSSSTIAKGSGNTMLTLTGSNFVPGVAVTWNGSYRTTTIVDATHVSVAIPATDLANTGTAKLVATNPGASDSNALTITIN